MGSLLLLPIFNTCSTSTKIHPSHPIKIMTEPQSTDEEKGRVCALTLAARISVLPGPSHLYWWRRWATLMRTPVHLFLARLVYQHLQDATVYGTMDAAKRTRSHGAGRKPSCLPASDPPLITNERTHAAARYTGRIAADRPVLAVHRAVPHCHHPIRPRPSCVASMYELHILRTNSMHSDRAGGHAYVRGGLTSALP
ncbi:hypothetical protein HDK77DRAFT_30681 [Phyllosticta capitalensis]